MHIVFLDRDTLTPPPLTFHIPHPQQQITPTPPPPNQPPHPHTPRTGHTAHPPPRPSHKNEGPGLV